MGKTIFHDKTGRIDCPMCWGTKTRLCPDCLGRKEWKSGCLRCKGTGQIPCGICKGRGYLTPGNIAKLKKTTKTWKSLRQKLIIANKEKKKLRELLTPEESAYLEEAITGKPPKTEELSLGKPNIKQSKMPKKKTGRLDILKSKSKLTETEKGEIKVLEKLKREREEILSKKERAKKEWGLLGLPARLKKSSKEDLEEFRKRQLVQARAHKRMYERAEKGPRPSPKERDEGGLFGSIAHSVSGLWKKKKKGQEKTIETVAPVAATAVGGPVAGAAAEAGIQAKEAAESQKEAAEAKKKAAEEEKETAEEKKSAKEEYEEKFYRKKLEKEFPEKKGGTLGFLKRGAKKEVHELKLTGMKGLGERKEAAKKTVFSSVQFLFTFPFTIWLLFSSTIPTVEGYMGKPILSREFAWIQDRAFDIALGVFVFALVVLLIPSLIRGGRGFDFSLPNGIILTILAFSVGLWLFDNPFFSFMGYVEARHPEEYEMMMCLIKYRGNMQICALGEEEIQYEKEGTYETLKMNLGIETPDRSIPPMRPNPKKDTYHLIFTLKNENEVGSLYDINISQEEDIQVEASLKEEGVSPIRGVITYKPPYLLIPGGYKVVETKFDDIENFIGCEKYLYFQINITSEQKGGGSAKYGIIESEEGTANENFMYFFDPEIKTNPGPLDVYLYTYPFVLPLETLTSAEAIPGERFRIYINIVNKGDGIAEITDVILIQTSEVDLPIIEDGDIVCDYTTTDADEYCEGKKGNCLRINLGEDKLIEKSENDEDRVIITCNGDINTDNAQDFIGKATDFISILVQYRYKQVFDEQIGCVRTSEGVEPTRKFNYTCCQVTGETTTGWVSGNDCPTGYTKIDDTLCNCTNKNGEQESGCQALCTGGGSCKNYPFSRYDSSNKVCTCLNDICDELCQNHGYEKGFCGCSEDEDSIPDGCTGLYEGLPGCSDEEVCQGLFAKLPRGCICYSCP